MKIIVINGSPKAEKSDTMHITRAFLEGMNSVSENQIKYINVIEKHIEYCKGDLSCMKNGGVCIHKDDMSQILEDILESDMILFSFPLYGFGIPAPLKALMDRTMPVTTLAMKKSEKGYQHEYQKDCSHLKYCVISGCGFPNSKHNFEALKMQFNLLCPKGLCMITVPEAPMFNAPQAAVVTVPFLEKVKKAGSQYAENGCISQDLQKELEVPMIPEEVYAAICSGKA